MAIYYFHLRDFKGATIEDEGGSELANLTVAKEHAMLSMHELIGEAIKWGHQLEIEAIIIADKHGTHLAAVPILAALPAAIVSLLKQPERIVPTGKFEEYRRNADDCRRKAESTDDINDKTSWLKLADAWLQMLPPTQAASTEPTGWPKTSEADSKASH